MEIPDIPYAWRLGALVVVVGLFIALDLRKPVGERHRWREYTFLLGGGILTSLLGVTVDSVTSRVSPEYFMYGKGIADGPGFATRVATLGAQAGLSAGVIGTGVLLLVNRAPERALGMFRLLWLPFLLAALCGAIAGVVLNVFPFYTHSIADALLESEPAHRFTVAWVTHMGVYIGGLVGLIVAAKRVRRALPVS